MTTKELELKVLELVALLQGCEIKAVRVRTEVRIKNLMDELVNECDQ